MKNKALTLKEFNALYTLEVVSTKKAAVKDNLLELGYQNDQANQTYRIITHATKEVVFEFDTDSDEKFIRTLMERFKIKELELYFTCD